MRPDKGFLVRIWRREIRLVQIFLRFLLALFLLHLLALVRSETVGLRLRDSLGVIQVIRLVELGNHLLHWVTLLLIVKGLRRGHEVAVLLLDEASAALGVTFNDSLHFE